MNYQDKKMITAYVQKLRMASLAVGALMARGVLPNALWTVSLPYAVFIVCFCFWQRFRSIALRPQMVFFDKMCINQEDEALKKIGILGLGAFVRHSKKMLVLWSTQTFSRLWCTYEVGCALNKAHAEQKDPADIEIFPVSFGYILLLLSVLWHLMIAIFYAVTDHFHSVGSTRGSFLLMAGGILTLISLLLLPVANCVGLRLMQEVEQLPSQLQGFRIQDSQCFCCSHNHRCPVSGRELACDRQLVYQTLAEMHCKEMGPDLPLDHS